MEHTSFRDLKSVLGVLGIEQLLCNCITNKKHHAKTSPVAKVSPTYTALLSAPANEIGQAGRQAGGRAGGQV